jgi:2-polyprenyl-3-methyl-5-hydroxy-6-metoxy-1,4-benzoquinol methylase
MNLAHRSTQAEQMDTDCADFEEYSRCLSDLSRVNVVTFTHRPMLGWLRHHAGDDRHFSVLDVACGHGDALRHIRRRHPNARLMGIDLNPWSTQAARQATDPADHIEFHTGDAFAFAPAQPFDFIISSQFTHHLTNEQVVGFLRWQQANAAKGWFIGDLHRHLIPYCGFPLLARLAGWHRIVRQDGQISIARAFIRAEWTELLRRAGVTDRQATITWYLPFRLCVASR